VIWYGNVPVETRFFLRRFFADPWRTLAWVILIVGALVLLDSLGVAITPLLTALGVGGLAVALALQDTLSNLFAGIYLLMSRKIRPGDFIQIENGAQGYVCDINLRHTTIRELANNLVVVPNTKMASAVNRNYSLPEQEVTVLVDVGVSYANDLANVERVTLDVARETLNEVSGGVPEFEPQVRYHTFADPGIRFTAVLRARAFVDQFVLKHEFIKRLHRRYGQEVITIPFPIRTVYLKPETDGDHPEGGADGEKLNAEKKRTPE